MGQFEDKVVVITGGAKGQGRCHAVGFAQQGADVVVADICEQIPCASPMGTREQLDETVALVEATGRRALGITADLRRPEEARAMVSKALDAFGSVDVLVANAGLAAYGPFAEMADDVWRDVCDVNLNAVAHSVRAVVPHLLERRRGRIVVTSSEVAREGGPNNANYAASKWAAIGFVKSVAIELAPIGITVNAVAPMSVSTDMAHNELTYRLFRPDLQQPTADDVAPAFAALNPMGVPWLEPQDVTDAVLFLASDAARYITGVSLDIACGWNAFHAA